MTPWSAFRDEYSNWLRSFPLIVEIGRPASAFEILRSSETPIYQNASFWSERTHEIESVALCNLTSQEIDDIFNDVASTLDEDLRRFDPLIAYFAQFFPDGDAGRIEDERDVAHCVKRDLAWAAVERVLDSNGFFNSTLAWYARGRWPCNWAGDYPAGHFLVL
jgi:hypothetical protein